MYVRPGKMIDAKEIVDIAASRYGEALYWHIRRIVVSREDAEDAMQETFLKIFTKAHTLSGGEGSLRPWLYRIATNEALMVLRRRTRLFESIDSLSDELCDMLSGESAPDADKTSVLFQKATLRLPGSQRLAFYLRYYDDLPYSEIAKITGKSEATLRTNYHYAVESIKKYLKDSTI